MSLHVAAYDVSDDGRRARVARVLERHGRRVQASVFKVWLEPSDFAPLRREVGSLLGAGDRFDVFPMDTRPGRSRMSSRRSPPRWDAVAAL